MDQFFSARMRVVLLVFVVYSFLPSLILAQDTSPGQDHGLSDAFYAKQAEGAPPFIVNESMLRVATAAELNTLGEWSAIIDWPHIPVSAAHLPDGRILTWASNEVDAFPSGPEYTYAANWDPVTGDFQLVPHLSHDMFCAHQVMLEDGKVFVTGGRNHVTKTSVYDFTTNTWSEIDPMNNGRWYPTTIAMPNGEVMTAIGSSGGPLPEVWTEGTGWRELTGANLQAPILDYTDHYENNWWPLLHVAPNGEVFHSGPTPDWHYIDPTGDGSISVTGAAFTDWYPKHGATVMYEEGKIITAGGAIAGGNTASTNRVITMDINGGAPVVTEIAAMAHARKFQNGVMLPTGEVLMVGGNTSGIKFNDSGTILTPEVWDPDTGTWTELADMAAPRNYHSVALLLPDARVFSGGGGLCGGCAANHQNAQVFTPPYLFDDTGALAVRPEITGAPESTRNGAVISVQATAGLTDFSLIKTSSTTHGVNTDVRFLSVPFTETSSGNYDLTMHGNQNVLTPGYWMLFGLNSDGVPSVAAMLLIATDGAPQVTNPGDQVTPEEENVSLQISATDPDGQSLSYSATGLPPGLSINSSTGLITGFLAQGSVGFYDVEVSVDDGDGTVTIGFAWAVTSGGTGEILREWWTGIGGTDISALTGDADYPDNPDGSSLETSFVAPTDWADDYGTRMRGYLYPPLTGNYTFWIASDDNGELWLSTDDSAANATMIANVPGWSSPLEWDKYAEQTSVEIFLTAGERYYIEALQKEGGGLDNLAVSWQPPGQAQEVINGYYMSPFNEPPVVTQPADQFSLEGETVSLTVVASDVDSGSLTFSATGLPSDVAIDENSGIISGTLADGSAGTHNVTVEVSDGQEVGSASFTWTVIEPGPAVGETGTVTTDASGSTWHTVNLTNAYINPVVVVGPPSFGEAEPLTMRVRNVTGTSFEVQLDEWDYLDGSHSAETFGYMVVETGIHTLHGGARLMAGKIDGVTNAWTTVSFPATFDVAPTVLSQLGSDNEASAAATRQQSVSATAFQVALDEEENNDNIHAGESIYWIAIEPAVSSDAFLYEVENTPNSVEEVWYTINFQQTYANPVFLAHMQTTNGGDPAVLRHQNLSGGSVEVIVEEEQSANDEIGHVTEVVGYVTFDQAGQIAFEGGDPLPLTVNHPGDQLNTSGEYTELTITVAEAGGPFTFGASGLPEGLSMDTATGEISGVLTTGAAGSATVTVTAEDDLHYGEVTFDWSVTAVAGSWIDFDDETASRLTLTSIGDVDDAEKDMAVADLNKDGWDDVIVVRKESFMGTGSRPDVLLMNNNGLLIDETDTFAPEFETRETIARDVVIGDFDGDGWEDVVIANTFGDEPVYYRNQGNDGNGDWLGLINESADRIPDLDLAAAQYCAVSAGDIDGDGFLDLYFANYTFDGVIEDVLLINDGAGNFADEGASRMGNLLNSAFGVQATIVDIDDDGDQDIVKLSAQHTVEPWGTDGIFILYNDGTGNFTNWSTVPGDDPYMFALGHFDDNEDLDFYIVNDGYDQVNLAATVVENSDMTFSESMTYWARTADHGGNLHMADLDHDGDLDLGVADVDSSHPPCTLDAASNRRFALLQNEGNATGDFIDPWGGDDQPWNQNIYDFVLLDVDKDGNLDMFMGGCDSYQMFVNKADPIVQGNLVADWDFEMGPVISDDPGWETYSAGQIIHDAWTVVEGTVDVHHWTQANAGAGLQPEGGIQHIDLQGDNPGKIAQMLTGLLPGETYELKFYYASYPHSNIIGTPKADIQIAGGATLDETVTGTTSGAVSWLQASYQFVPTSISEELTFSGYGSSRAWGGVLIDLVEVTLCDSCNSVEPVVNSFTPESGEVGTEVTISGVRFTGVTEVKFGDTAAAEFTLVSDVSITATVPEGAETGPIQVTTSNGAASSASDFTVTEPPPPPSEDNLVVDWDFETGPVISDDPGWQTYSSGEIIHDAWTVVEGTVDVHHWSQANAGAGLQPEGGLQHIDLQGDNPGKLSQTINGMVPGDTYELRFYYASYPHSSIVGTPKAEIQIAAGATLNETVTATTSGAVSWQFASYQFVPSNTSEELTFRGYGSAREWGGVLLDLVEVVHCSSCNSTDPVISSFTPESGEVGTEVTIEGIRFTGLTEVWFGDTQAATFTLDSDASITATVPDESETGPIKVVTADGEVTSASDFTVTEPPPPPDAGNLVVDWDFETGPVIPATPGWETYSAGEVIHGVWQVTEGTVDVHYWTQANAGAGLQPEGGLQHIDLQGDTPGAIMQEVNGLAVGEEYTLSFYYAAYPDDRVVGTAQVQVQVAGGALVDDVLTANTPGDETWVSASYNFTATATTAEVQFRGFGSDRVWGGVLLDLVSISCVACDPSASTFSVSTEDELEIPTEFVYDVPYPNPFKTQTTFRYGLPEASEVNVQVYNVTGRLIQTLVNNVQPAGYHRIRWNGRDAAGSEMASGMYLVVMEAGGERFTVPVILVR